MGNSVVFYRVGTVPNPLKSSISLSDLKKEVGTLKNELFQALDKLAPELTTMADFIFDHPEIGLQEHKASALLCDYLENQGFCVERGVGGFDTAFRATYEKGKNGVSFGLLCEYDALEDQGHACGHHVQGPAVVGAVVALKGLLTDKPFKIVVYGTPAEETISGKITMMKNGCFQDIDIALMMHLSSETCVDVKSMALSKFTVTFHGQAAHAALKPEAGKGALDALILSFQGLEFMREHVQDDVRIHYTVLDAGGPANTVSPRAVGSFYVRSYNRTYLNDVVRRFYNVMKGAALMTDTTVEIHLDKEVDSKIPVISLNDLLMANAKAVNAPEIKPPREKTGSTDFGNVMYKVPGSCIRVSFVPGGVASHSQEYLDAGKSQAAHDALLYGAKIMAGTCYDLLEEEGTLERVLSEFKQNQIAALKI